MWRSDLGKSQNKPRFGQRNRIARTLRKRLSKHTHWQRISTGGAHLWTWIAWAFAAYWACFVSGALAGQKQLNFVGAVVVLLVLSWAVLERLWVRMDSIALASLALGLLPAIQAFTSTVPISYDYVIKHVSLCLVMAISRMLRLPVIARSRVRRMLAAQVLLILFISLTLHRGNSWDGSRFSGMFANPNNLALIPFLLLLLIDRVRDSRLIQGGAHAVVILVLAFTSTSGAVLGYLIGLVLYLSARLSRNSRIILWSTGTGLLFLVGAGFCVVEKNVLPDTRITNQIFLMRSDLGRVLQGEKIQYYEQEKVMGSGSGSALWRVQHWRDTLVTYSGGTPAELIFGFGPGSSIVLCELLPHNDYLRMLFEEGIVGLALFLFAWIGIIRAAPSGIRYVGVSVAVYCFSENNLDNFPFMALLALCLSATANASSASGRGGAELPVAQVRSDGKVQKRLEMTADHLALEHSGLRA